ncbi:MAG: hypothetical protein IV088_07255 [Hydrogenophaga sp.]|jgi:hypothetical protein|uniref:hypothetical protein n=1 Tax=Hydrogenophaga sp. TaxID=1904254 RepID=UPI0025B8EE76|nr:hypothetical protein [Hydrogenophaga sp.]MBT9550626.1 hypothetical protein [Hydrogenophaga sp.]
MSLSFHAKTITWLVLSSTLLGAGILMAATGRTARQAAEAQQTLLGETRTKLDESRGRAETYSTLIERIGWRPGQALRHETIDTSATIAGHEGDRLNEILRANHVGKGQFFLRSLTLETQRSTRNATGSLKLSIKGDNILVLDRP